MPGAAGAVAAAVARRARDARNSARAHTPHGFRRASSVHLYAAHGSNMPLWDYQEQVRKKYNSSYGQACVISIIGGNFLVQCVQVEIDPDGDKYQAAWNAIEDFFNVIFTLELSINMYGRWFRPFWQSRWNQFDTVVVLIGLLDLFRAPLPGPLRLARMIRVFRAFRLFGKVESIRKIITSVRRALPGVVNAFIITLIMMCIFAVIGVVNFRFVFSEECRTHFDGYGDSVPGSLTLRNACYGLDYYGSFDRSLYSMFQVLTGESWSEAVARPVIHYFEKQGKYDASAGSAIFFIIFYMVNSVVLLNVIVALLIEGMGAHEDSEREAAHSHEHAPEHEHSNDHDHAQAHDQSDQRPPEQWPDNEREHSDQHRDQLAVSAPPASNSREPGSTATRASGPEARIKRLRMEVASVQEDIVAMSTELSEQVKAILSIVQPDEAPEPLALEECDEMAQPYHDTKRPSSSDRSCTAASMLAADPGVTSL